MNIKRIIILLFALAVVIFAVVIFKIYSDDQSDFFKLSINAAVIEVYSVRGRPLQRSAKLSNGRVIAVPSEFTQYIQTGDTVIKDSNSYKVTLKSISLNKLIQTQ